MIGHVGTATLLCFFAADNSSYRRQTRLDAHGLIQRRKTEHKASRCLLDEMVARPQPPFQFATNGTKSGAIAVLSL